MRVFDGVVIGLVEDLDDPDNLDRIKVTFPWLADSVKSYWARQARLMAGENRGTHFMPEKGDEALVAFEHGDARFPYIIGFLWNGIDTPPNSDIDRHVRRIRTTTGHKMDFDDRGGKEAVTITTQGKHVADLNDANKQIKISTTKSHVVNLDDGHQKIEIISTGGHSVTLDDQALTVTVKSAGGHTITLDDTQHTVSVQTTAQQSVVLSDAAQSVTAKTSTGHTVSMLPAAVTVAFSGGGSLVLTAGTSILQHGHAITVSPGGIAFA